MHRKLTLRILGVAASATVAACGPGGLAREFATPQHPPGSVKDGGDHPLLLDWDGDALAVVSNSRAKGPLIVRYADGVLTPLYDCRAKGAYVYKPLDTPVVNDSIVESSDQLHAVLPSFGLVKFEGALKRAGKLHIRKKIVGTYDTEQQVYRLADLSGQCDGATHVTTHVTAGAFKLYTLSSGDLSGDTEVKVVEPAKVDGSSASSEQNLNFAGKEESCALAKPGDREAPPDCSISLQLFLSRIEGVPAEPAPTSGDSQRTAGWVVGGIGAASVVAGGALIGIASGKKGDCNTSDGSCPTQDQLDTYKSGRSMNNAGWIALGVGAAGVIGGVTLLLTAPSSTTTAAARPALGVTAGPGMLTLGGTF